MDMRNIKVMGPHKYRIRFKYRDPLTNRQQVYQETLTGVSLTQARARRDAARAECLRAMPSINRSLRLRDCVASYQADRVLRDPGRRRRQLALSSLEVEANTLERVILPSVGDWLVANISLRDLDDQVRRWGVAIAPTTGNPYASSTINGWVGVLRRLVRHGAALAGVDDPARELEGVAQSASTVARALTAEEARALLGHLGERGRDYYALVYLMLVTAARVGEATALHWDQVVDGYLVLDHAARRGVRRARTKTGHVSRVRMLPELVDVLEAQRAWLRESRHPRAGGAVVFPSRRGRSPYMSSSTFNTALKRAAEAIGIARFRPHDLRHTANTIMLSEGVEERAVRALTGHSSPALTHHYDHPGDAERARATGVMLRVLDGGKGQPGVNEEANAEEEVEQIQHLG